MNYQEVFVVFWEQVKESIQEGRFAKLTMAKTIGKPDLKNIFVRPISFENNTKVAVKFRFRSKETEDTLNEYTLDEAFHILKPHLKESFLSVLLFTTTKDVTFKINKKGAGSITENFPTFHNVTLAENNLD
tara:strand:+ start:33984 stop:34376 length:393 start_codon:yes stop_codon:yes gene_type:complete